MQQDKKLKNRRIVNKTINFSQMMKPYCTKLTIYKPSIQNNENNRLRVMVLLQNWLSHLMRSLIVGLCAFYKGRSRMYMPYLSTTHVLVYEIPITADPRTPKQFG